MRLTFHSIHLLFAEASSEMVSVERLLSRFGQERGKTVSAYSHLYNMVQGLWQFRADFCVWDFIKIYKKVPLDFCSTLQYHVENI